MFSPDWNISEERNGQTKVPSVSTTFTQQASSAYERDRSNLSNTHVLEGQCTYQSLQFVQETIKQNLSKIGWNLPPLLSHTCDS